MLREAYQRSQSFSVPEELLQKTAAQMRAAQQSGRTGMSAEFVEAGADKDQKTGVRGRPSPRGEEREVRLHFSFKRLSVPLAAAAAFLVVVSGVGSYFNFWRSNSAAAPGAGAPEGIDAYDSATADAPEITDDPLAGGQVNELWKSSEAAADALAPFMTMAGMSPVLLSVADLEREMEPYVIVHTFEELQNSADPWTEEISQAVTQLPVYRNTCVLDETGAPLDPEQALTQEEMEAVAQEAAELLGDPLLPAAAAEDVPEEIAGDPYVRLTESGRMLLVASNGQVTLRSASEEQETAIAREEEVSEQEEELLELVSSYCYGLEIMDPVIGSMVTYSWSGEPWSVVTISDQSGTLESNIVSYHLSSIRAEGAGDVEEVLSLMLLSQEVVYDGLWREEIGSYPLRTLEEAYADLYAEDYLIGADMEALVVDPESVVGVTLDYCGDVMSEYVQPVYTFYVEADQADLGLAEQLPEGLRLLVRCWVPAVAAEYVTLSD